MPSSPLDTKLYNKVKQEAKQRFQRWPSLYGSAWVSKEYKRRGGTYHTSSKRQLTDTGVNRWFREEWVQVLPYVTAGKRVPCGSRKGSGKACRPLKRITKDTPITLDEILRIHDKKKIASLASHKTKNMDSRVSWRKGTISKRYKS